MRYSYNIFFSVGIATPGYGIPMVVYIYLLSVLKPRSKRVNSFVALFGSSTLAIMSKRCSNRVRDLTTLSEVIGGECLGKAHSTFGFKDTGIFGVIVSNRSDVSCASC